MNRSLLLGVLASTALLFAACSNKCGVNNEIKPGSAEDFESNVPNTVYFDFDKSSLTDSAKKRVNAQACWLNTYSNMKAAVEGHTDVRGTAEYNMALGEARATSVKKFLAEHSVDTSRLSTVSYGKERVIDQETTEEAHAKNRRSVTIVSAS